MIDILQIVQFPTQISSIYCAQWSQNHRLAMATRKGVYVFDLIPDPSFKSSELNLGKTLIPTQQNPSYADPLLSLEEINKLEPDLKNRIIQDRVLTQFSTTSENYSHMRCVCWTPLTRLGNTTDHYLVTLSVDYSLRILGQKDGSSWKCVLNLTDIIIHHLKTTPKTYKLHCLEKVGDKAYEKVFKKAYLAATISICWSQDNRFVTGQEGGQVIFWRLVEGEVLIDRILQPNIGAITAIHHHTVNNRSVYYIGSFTGMLTCIVEPKYNIIPVLEDLDRLSVSRIQTSGDRILVCKSSFILALDISWDFKSNKAEILKQSEVRAGTASIVGLEEVDLAAVSDLDHGQPGDLEPGLDPNRRPPGFLVLAQRGKLQLWQPDKPATEVKLDIERRDYITWGLLASPNKALYCLVECLSSFNDHLLMREPTRLVFFTLTPPRVLRERIESYDFMPDYMELARVRLYQGKSFMEKKKEESFNNPQCLWWINSVLVQLEPTQARLEQLVAIETHLRCSGAASVLLSDQFSEKSRYSAANFIINFTDNQESRTEAREILRKMDTQTWNCAICEAEAKEEAFRHVTCHSNHRWGRCGLTCEPTDCATYGLACLWCGAQYMAAQDQVINCTMCTGPLVST